MQEIIFVGAGGFIGSCLRYGISKLFNAFSVIPLGTLISNVLAGILIGLFIGIENNITLIPPKARLFLITGMLGGLSTFSTFSLETVTLFKSGKLLLGTGNVALNLGLSIFGVLLGMAITGQMAKIF